MKSIALAIIAIGLTFYSGFHHYRVRRAGLGESNLEAQIDALESLPETFGDWRLTREHEFSDEIVKILECDGYHLASYENPKLGFTVQATVLLGASGPTAVHTPEGCMVVQSFRQVSDREKVLIEDMPTAPDVSVWIAEFESTEVDKSHARVAYAWSTDGNWRASESARSEFGGKPYLYKLQVSTPLPFGYDVDKRGDPLEKFLPDFIEALHRTAFEGVADGE